MAKVEGIEHSRISPQRLIVAQTLNGLPALEEALAPNYMKATLIPLSVPDVRWKLDHSLRVAEVGGEVQEELGLKRKGLSMQRAGIAHDLFQACTSPDGEQLYYSPKKAGVLNKQGMFVKDDWDIIEPHPEESAAYLKRFGETEAAVMAHYHHAMQGESSYPRDMNINSFEQDTVRTIAIFGAIDTADALFTPRPYPKWVIVNGERVLEFGSTREPWSTDRVEEELGRKFGDVLPGEIVSLVTKISERHAGQTTELLSDAA